jgi:hypothetical protein
MALLLVKIRFRIFLLSKRIRAVRQKVNIGLVGTEYVEILDGLDPGDRVIISDVPRSRHKDIMLDDF